MDSLVEVTAIKIKAGEKFCFDEFEDCLMQKCLEDMSVPLQEEKESLLDNYHDLIVQAHSPLDPDSVATEDNYIFKFRVISDQVISGLEATLDEMGPVDIFDGYEDEFTKIAENLMMPTEAKYEKIKGFEPVMELITQAQEEQQMVKFITAWDFHSWRDDWSGEYDCVWDFLGVVNINKIEVEKE